MVNGKVSLVGILVLIGLILGVSIFAKEDIGKSDMNLAEPTSIMDTELDSIIKDMGIDTNNISINNETITIKYNNRDSLVEAINICENILAKTSKAKFQLEFDSEYRDIVCNRLDMKYTDPLDREDVLNHYTNIIYEYMIDGLKSEYDPVELDMAVDKYAVKIGFNTLIDNDKQSTIYDLYIAEPDKIGPVGLSNLLSMEGLLVSSEESENGAIQFIGRGHNEYKINLDKHEMTVTDTHNLDEPNSSVQTTDLNEPNSSVQTIDLGESNILPISYLKNILNKEIIVIYNNEIHIV